MLLKKDETIASYSIIFRILDFILFELLYDSKVITFSRNDCVLLSKFYFSEMKIVSLSERFKKNKYRTLFDIESHRLKIDSIILHLNPYE